MAGLAGAGRVLVTWAGKYPLAPRWRREERAWLRAADGVRLFAAVLPGPDDAPLTVVLLHGFLNSSRSPKVHAFARALATRVHVVVPDLRGHGASAGHTTFGLREPLDVAAAVRLARARWSAPVVTVGTSLGGFVALLHAGTHDGVDGVVAVSAPGYWLRADREGSKRLVRLIRARAGRALAAALLRTRIGIVGDEQAEIDRAVASIAPAFTLLVHDRDDTYFGPEHAEHLYETASDPKEIWWVDGGHGSDLLTPEFAERLLTHLVPTPSR